MRRATLTFTLGAALSVLAVPAATAMGFGRTVTATTLGQPLDFFANVALDVDESLARECVGADVLIGESRVAPENIRVTLESASDPGERRVRVTTRTVVDEPVVTVDVRVGCKSQMTKRFVAFIDPPMLRLASVDDESFTPQRVDPQVAPLLDIVRSADASRRRAPDADATASTSAAGDSRRTARPSGRQFAASPAVARSAPLRVAQATRPRAHGPSDAGAGAAAAVRSAPRLRLEAATGLAALPSTSSASATLAAAPTAVSNLAAEAASTQLAVAQAAAAVASAALGQEQDRMQALEAGLTRLRIDTQAQQKTLGALQARLKQAEGERYANGLVYTLAGGMLFFALLAAAFYALRPRQRRRARWFDASQQQRRAPSTPRPSAAAETAAETVHTPAVSQHPSQWNEGASSIGPLTAPATIGGLEVTTVLAPQSHYARMAEATASANSGAPAAAARNASPSMEELIDLEQQAEFFVVLGQDEAAIALLSSHLHAAGGGSPLPYLQLLEIHQRREDRNSYEEVRRSFHRHFNAYAPEWSSDLHFGRALEEYPQAIARLQALWPTPLHAMQSLDSLLFRRTEADETFDFPAYRELLFLYSIARELAGNVETDAGSIDLFLPLDDTPTEPNLRPEVGFSVDLDVSSWLSDTPAEGLVIRRSVGRRGAS